MIFIKVVEALNVLKKSVSYLFLTLIFIITIFPIFYTVMGSFKSNAEILTQPGAILPREITFDNYITIWNSDNFDLGRMFWNSIYYTIVVVAANIITSAMGGYVFARSEFPGKKLIFGMFTALMFINLGNIVIVPLLNIAKLAHLQKSLWGLILIRALSVQIVYIYLVKSYVIALPKELDEAARIDGCNFAQIFFRIIMPLLKPIIATIAILAFQATWNDYLLPTVFTLNIPDQRTLIVGVVALKSSGTAASQWNLMLAGSTISILPVLIVYIFANRYFIAGLSSGAVKG